MGFRYLILDVAIAYALDLAFGDPYRLPHPVRLIGRLVTKTEKILRGAMPEKLREDVQNRARYEFMAGCVLTAFVICAVFAAVLAVTAAAFSISPWFFHIINIYFLYTSLAARCLSDEALKVLGALREGDPAKSRRMLSMLVGRETQDLDEKQIIRAVVETTAENTTDGIVSPIFYAVIGSLFGIGAPLAYAFKAVNTLDSMVGYKNGKYRYFGTASAKADDAANFIPARLTGLLIPLCAAILGKNAKNSFFIMKRDRLNHKSPNSAHAEAAVAGALGVRLGGPAVYFGELVDKPYIGDDTKPLEASDINDAVKLAYITSAVSLLLFGGAGILLAFAAGSF